jgi:hypothetical protein
MNAAQRKIYFGGLWPAACHANGWKRSDDDQRRAVLHNCMRAIKGPLIDSSSDLGPDEVTALFTYLQFLAHQDSLELSARWLDCQQDYHAFNRARQADWHESETYGKGKNKLDRDRFGGASSAQGEALEEFDPEAIRRRHLTMASRHQKKLRREAKAAAPAPAAAPAGAHYQDGDGNPF